MALDNPQVELDRMSTEMNFYLNYGENVDIQDYDRVWDIIRGPEDGWEVLEMCSRGEHEMVHHPQLGGMYAPSAYTVRSPLALPPPQKKAVSTHEEGPVEDWESSDEDYD
ncbi:hypothetical protein CASFOL_018732 [Castilleja foliolosa]|uniref:Uncharacterized protein n=1 Tax=Castilleja foliolosa TaxID=1961234 RepID=A0ABD3D8I3_9LAMI